MADQKMQLGFDLGEPDETEYVSSHSVRLELHALLDAAKAATKVAPWDEKTMRHHRNSFPIKAKVLPPEEANFLWRQFEVELNRIEGFQLA
ncbi:hypothetical protein [Parasphingorhabdus halotolerans]|uniref:Uncharacterized protein n=1 Tax=Parasphingorhabdus halotolerans TaxID=2725558 RepID=A0A6H2DRH7_9SPHN|nr:hypothetical protein [Parasphingorhabdus halotolerans]QJB70266.1 hypothetical protein HF685_14105 [Parasphingorhabdus halotolerans]